MEIGMYKCMPISVFPKNENWMLFAKDSRIMAVQQVIAGSRLTHKFL
jgi:hypothetical protein